ncbi:MAG: hypothetical protein QNJ37_07335 [Crocosphaera sp.]|nr:hypothetical protein [Crocosphaera sp.]
MSNPSPDYQSPGPLSVGNVISAAARIYRDRFAVYYKLALIAYLWGFVPIYGWAKFMAISGLLSRLAYGEVSGQPESVREARRHINPRLWTFFLTALLVGLIFLGWYLLFLIIWGLVLFVLATLASQDGAWFVWGIFVLLVIVGIVLFIISILWLSSRLYLTDLAIAIENQSSVTKVINRSWQLTKQFILRIMLIVFVAFLIAIPISLALQIIDTLIRLILMVIFSQDSIIFGLVYFPLSFIISFAISAILLPFWQSIKAVVYYDLRSRREGIDIQLRDSI